MKYSPITALSFIIIFTVSCKDNSNPPPISASNTPAQKFAELNINGSLPQLDRSESITGPDLDGNGIRDDVDRYINALTIAEPQKQAARQSARAVQQALLVDITDDSALQQARKKMGDASRCLSIRIANAQEMYRLGQAIQAVTANTKARAKRYDDYNQALSGSVFRLSKGDTCDE